MGDSAARELYDTFPIVEPAPPSQRIHKHPDINPLRLSAHAGEGLCRGVFSSRVHLILCKLRETQVFVAVEDHADAPFVYEEEERTVFEVLDFLHVGCAD